MAGAARSSSPRRPQPAVDLNGLLPVKDDVRRLQRTLWAAAKQSSGRRFHALYDRIARRDVLVEVWKRVRANSGAAGVDRQTLADVEGYGVDRLMSEIAEVLDAGTYRSAPSRRVEIPKPAGGVRPLGIPTVNDRIVQAATKIVIEPIVEADFAEASYVRYADDAVAMCHTRRQAEQALAAVHHQVGRLGLVLHPEKTRIVDLRDGEEGFDFLGWHFRARMSGRVWEQRRVRRYYLHRWPSTRSVKRIREKIRHLTRGARCHADIREVIADLNCLLCGWGGYFRTGNAALEFNQLDRYVAWRLRRLMVTRFGRNLHAGHPSWDRDFFEAHGLHRLRGTVQYPIQKAA